jgi:hypothetical protein
MNVKRKIAVMALAVCLTVAMMPFFYGSGSAGIRVFKPDGIDNRQFKQCG